MRFRSTLEGFLLAVKLGTPQSLYVYLKDGAVSVVTDTVPLVTIRATGDDASNLLDGYWHNMTMEMGFDADAKVRVDNGPWAVLPLKINEIAEVTIGGGHTQFSTDFVGCIQDVMVNGKRFVESDGTKTGTLVFGGCTRVQQCGENTCNKGGDCVDEWVKSSCNCYRQYYGETCDKGVAPFFSLLLSS